MRSRFNRVPPVVTRVRADSLTYLEPSALKDLFGCVSRLDAQGIEGSLIEAGCALGGSAIVMATAKARSRRLEVYDVFGMIPPPSEYDGVDVHKRYAEILSGHSPGIDGNTYYGYEDNLLAQVRDNFKRYRISPEDSNVHLVQGLFQDTLRVEEPVALAHLDGDWYESTMVCLERIEPFLVPGGALIIDDYDCWSGAHQAVDEYFADKRRRYRFARRSRLQIVRI